MRRTLLMGSLTACAFLVFLRCASAQPLFSSTISLELTVARADAVVVGKIVEFKADTLIATLAVEETLKGMPRERLTVYLPYNHLERWKLESRRLLVAATTTGGVALDLTDGELEVMSADFTVLRKAADAIRVAKETARRFQNKEVQAFGLRVPSEACRGTKWGGRNLTLSVPVDDRLEKRAREYLQSKDYRQREEGARALEHFKSDENIALLKPLLDDREYTTLERAEANQGVEVRNYDVRQAALGTLQNWGVKVDVPPIRVKTLRTDIESLSIGQVPDDLPGRLREFKKLRELWWYSGVNDVMLKKVAGLTQLERLRLTGHSNNDVTDVGIKEIKALTNLTVLELHCPKMTDASLKELAGLKNLRFLDLTYANLNGSGLKNMACLPNLEGLYLHRTRMNDAAMKALAPCANLKTLHLSETRVTDIGMRELAPCRALTTLQLGYSKVTHAGLKELAPLRNLTTIDMYSIHVTDDTLRVLREIDLLHALNLATGENNSRPRSADEVVEFELGRIYQTQATDAGLKELAVFKNLATLYLPDQITDAGIKELQQFKKLTNLYLGGDRLTETGLKDLKKLPSLHTLGLRATNARLRTLREGGLLHVLSFAYGKGGARPKSVDDIIEINLRYSAIQDGAIKELVSLKNLVTLNIEHTEVGNAGLEHLASFAKLQSLDLSETAVTDAGLKHLEALSELRELHVRNTNVTDAGVFALRKVLPKCRVHTGR